MEYFDKRPKNVHESYMELVSSKAVEVPEGLLMTLRFAGPVTPERMYAYTDDKNSAVTNVMMKMYREHGWADEDNHPKVEFNPDSVMEPSTDLHEWKILTKRAREDVE